MTIKQVLVLGAAMIGSLVTGSAVRAAGRC
jgi:hypothetical protein